MRVLVTGGAGFIGSHLVDALVQHGHEVAVVDDLSAGRSGLKNPDARFYKVSITDFDGLSRVFAAERPEAVSHHAAQISVRRSMADPSFDALVNVVGTVNVLRLSATHDCERVVFASSCAVYSDPVRLPLDESHPAVPASAYGTSKLAAEDYLRFYGRVHGLQYVAFRYGNVYGPRQDPAGESGAVSIFGRQMLSGQQVTIYGTGTKTRDYVYISDVVEANLAAMRLPGAAEVLNLARGIEVSDYEVFDLVRRAAQGPTRSRSTQTSAQAKWRGSASTRPGRPRSSAGRRPWSHQRASGGPSNTFEQNPRGERSRLRWQGLRSACKPRKREHTWTGPC